MWFYNILSVVIGIIVAIAALYLLFRLFVLKQGNEKVILLDNLTFLSRRKECRKLNMWRRW